MSGGRDLTKFLLLVGVPLVGLVNVVEHDLVLVSDESEFIFHVTTDDITEISLL